MMETLLWKCGDILDELHPWIVIVPYVLAILKRDKEIFVCWVYLLFGSQILFLGCPLTVLTDWLKQFKVHDYNKYDDSLVHWLFGWLEIFGWAHIPLGIAILTYAAFITQRKLRSLSLEGMIP